MVHEQHQLVEEREARIHFVRHQMESEQRASLRILESASQERDPVRQEAQNYRGNYHSSEQIPREEVQYLTFHVGEVRKTQ